MSQSRPSRPSFFHDILIVLVTALITNVSATALVVAWSGPPASPPNGNVSTLLNVGSSDQVKNANLSVNGLSVFGNSLLNPGAYLNWGTTAGSGGYGMRDAGGILEFKTATGTWQSIQTIITTAVSSSTSWQSGPNGSIYYSSGGVAIGASTMPVATLDINGIVRLAPQTNAPVTCDSAHTGSIAVSDATSHFCVCNGTSWVFDYNGAACTWNTIPDTTSPTVVITSPANGATVSGTISVTATASDNIGVVGVYFRMDSTIIGAEDTTAPYSVSWDTTSTNNGVHTLTATARDTAGNETTSTVVNVTVYSM